MSTLATHETEQAALCEAGNCGHTDCQPQTEYAFDVKLFATIRVKATSEAEARTLLRKHVDAADTNFGAWPNGDPIIGEASLDDNHPELIEINGEAV